MSNVMLFEWEKDHLLDVLLAKLDSTSLDFTFEEEIATVRERRVTDSTSERQVG